MKKYKNKESISLLEYWVANVKKNAPLDRVEVYRVNQHPVNIEYLNRFVPTKIEIDEKKII